jgi:protease IV
MNYNRESIFRNSIRSFFVAFSAIIGVTIAIVVIALVFSSISNPDIVPKKGKPHIAPDAHGNRSLLSTSTPAILLINIHGVIGSTLLTQHLIENTLLDSQEGILHNQRVKGVLLSINTPGGTALDSDGIYRALLAYKAKYNVPVYAFVNGLCASGGMYVASAADKVFATPESIIGSVGVVLGPTFNFTGTLAKFGAEALTLTEGKDKDALNPFRQWKPGEDRSFKDLLTISYDRFLDIVTSARPNLSREKLVNEYGAHIFAAPVAQEYGYIDEGNSDYNSALSALTAAAGIDEKTPYQVIQFSPPFSLFGEISQKASPLLTGKLNHTFQFGYDLPSEMYGKVLYLYQPI